MLLIVSQTTAESNSLGAVSPYNLGMGTSVAQRTREDLGVHPGCAEPYLGIHTVQIFVRDQDESLRFYVDQLGFSVAFDARLQGGDRWVAVSPRDGSAVLALIAPPPESWQCKLIGRNTGVVLLTEDVIATYHEWRNRGVRFTNTPRLRRFKYDSQGAVASPAQDESDEHPPVWGGVFTRFKDIDGNSFGLVGFDTVNRQIQAQRRRAAEKQEAERRLAQELEIARQVQERLFPQCLPSIETLDYAGSCIPARQVGGDYHDFLDLGHGRYGLVVADIAGKGIAAALLMANLQANLRSQCAIALDEPERLLRSVNQLFYENTTQEAYATLFFADYCDVARRLRYANCGHLAGLLLRRCGSLERLDSTATVLGLFPRWDCSIAHCDLAPGDTLVLFTDGITESFDAAEEEFGEDRLVNAVETRRELPAASAVASIIEEVRRFSPHEQHDDITLILAKCK